MKAILNKVKYLKLHKVNTVIETINIMKTLAEYRLILNVDERRGTRVNHWDVVHVFQVHGPRVVLSSNNFGGKSKKRFPAIPEFPSPSSLNKLLSRVHFLLEYFWYD